MKISVYFTPLGVTSQAIGGKPVLVLDVLRATTSIVAAMANGARSVVPAESPDEALRLASNLERDGVLLAGERNMLRVDGFDLGNSPLEMTGDVVTGKNVVMATTNGTPALLAADAGDPVLVGAVTNFSAVVARAREECEKHGELHILCAGRRRMFALEDAYTAGRFAHELVPARERRAAELNDAAIAALELVRRYGDRWRRAVGASAAAQDLKQLGFKSDLDAATEVDTYPVIPVYSERLVRLPPPTQRAGSGFPQGA
jgi:2-phosphosulfolactate phosphatase